METYHRVGKVKDAHGIRGELFIVLFAGEADWADELKEIRLIQENSDAPAKTYTVKSVRAHKNGLIAKTNEIADRNEAETLKGWLLEIPESMLTSEPGEEIYLREILGFEVITSGLGNVGRIKDFGSNGFQDLLIIQTKDGDFEVPFVEEFVDEIDYESKKIHMDLPMGLLGEEMDETEEETDEKDSE